jgi:MoxR-like ATPase
MQMQSIVPKVIVADHVYEAAIDLARLSRPEEGKLPPELRDKIQYGAGPRASIALLMAGKARALLHKRCHVTTEDICAVAPPVLRHRIIPTFNAEAAGLDIDQIVKTLVDRHRATLRA